MSVRPLVLGATGFIGLNLVDALIASGKVPTCATRRSSWQLRRRAVPTVLVDLDDQGSLVAAMRGHEVVYHAAGHYPRLSTNREATLRTGLAQQRRVLDAAADAGVRRLVYVSSTATVAPADRGPSTEAHVFAQAPAFGVYHALKWSMEQLALNEDRFEVLVACPSGCIGPWDLRLGTCAPLVAVARGMDPAHPDGIVDLVDVRDVARALVSYGTLPAPPRRVLLSARWFQLHELLCDLASRYGAPVPSSPLSAEAARDMAEREEGQSERTGARPALSREIVDLVVHGVPIDASASASSLGITWTPWEHTLSAWEAWAHRMALLPRARTTETYA